MFRLFRGLVLCSLFLTPLAGAQVDPVAGIPNARQVYSGFQWTQMAQIFTEARFKVETVAGEDGAVILLMDNAFFEGITASFMLCGETSVPKDCQIMVLLTWFGADKPGATLEVANAFNNDTLSGAAFIDGEKDLMFARVFYAPAGFVKGNIVLNSELFVNEASKLYELVTRGSGKGALVVNAAEPDQALPALVSKVAGPPAELRELLETLKPLRRGGAIKPFSAID